EHHPDGAKAGLLLPVDLYGALIPAAEHGDTVHPDCARGCGGDSDCAAVCGGCRGKELVATANCRLCSDVYCCVLQRVYSTRDVDTVEPAYECMERSGSAGRVSA